MANKRQREREGEHTQEGQSVYYASETTTTTIMLFWVAIYICYSNSTSSRHIYFFSSSPFSSFIHSFSPASFSDIFDTRCTIDIDSDSVSPSAPYVKLYDVIRRCDGDNFSWFKLNMMIVIGILICLVLCQQGKIFCLFFDLFNRIICHRWLGGRTWHIVLMRTWMHSLDCIISAYRHCYPVNVTSWNSRISPTTMTNAFFKWWKNDKVFRTTSNVVQMHSMSCLNGSWSCSIWHVHDSFLYYLTLSSAYIICMYVY